MKSHINTWTARPRKSQMDSLRIELLVVITMMSTTLRADSILQFEFGSYSVSEGAGSVLIGVARSGDGSSPIAVDYSTAAGTAVAGIDFSAVSGTLSFGPGEKVKTFTVPILNDAVKEQKTSFRVTLTNPAGAAVLGAQKTATVTILDNDPGVQFESAAYRIQENGGALRVKVLRGNDGALDALRVDYVTADLTARAGEDYTSTRGDLEFAPGETETWLTVPIMEDQVAEPDETFNLILNTARGALVFGPNGAATITILDATGMAPHGFKTISIAPDRGIQLVMDGGVSQRFEPFFDIYPIERSDDLIHWSHVKWLIRTNSSPSPVVFTDAGSAQAPQRFYRTPANHFIAPGLPPTGAFGVGRVDRLVTDPNRRNRYDISTNGSFMITIRYPALVRAGDIPAPLEDLAIESDSDPHIFGALADRGPQFTGYAIRDAAFAPGQSSCPIVLASHGLTSFRDDLTSNAEDLASHGYVVISVDHFDASATVFPDGTYLKGIRSDSEAGMRDRVNDLVFVLDELGKWNQTDPLFAGKLDLEKVAAIGFSWGGATAAEFCLTDPRCKAAILCDPALWGQKLQQAKTLSTPTLTMHNSSNGDTTMQGKASAGSIWFQLSNTVHVDLSSDYWWPSPVNIQSGREVARTIHSYSVWFLNKFLRGIKDPMPPLRDYPRVINFKQK